MKRFTQLFCEVDTTTRTNEKVAALEKYFREAPPEDASWALFFLIGRKIPRLIASPLLWKWCTEESGLPWWLVEESYHAVGDAAEAISLLMDGSEKGTEMPLHELVHERLLPLRELPESQVRERVISTWRELNQEQRFLWNKLITGNFRIGAGRTLVIRSLASVAGISQAEMSHRILGAWEPAAGDYARLLDPQTSRSALAQPYPFFLASPLEDAVESLGNPSDWQAEWKWDGIRAQLIHRDQVTCIWSRGEEGVTESFPEIASAASLLPSGTVLDGEILAWNSGRPLSFGILQRRLGRKKVRHDVMRAYPVAFLSYDLLEEQGEDLRKVPLVERRKRLEQLIGSPDPALPIRISPLIAFSEWSELTDLKRQSRARGVEGLMLKRKNSPYQVGRPRGDWWKWKVDPFLIDAVLVYAQRGSGRRASLHTDYTFALWEEGELVPVAKAYSGLSDAEIKEVDAFVRSHTVEKRGPVRVVEPSLVFEIAFEGIQISNRHRSGVAVRFPRIHRWRHDKKPVEADQVERLRALAGMENKGPDSSGGEVQLEMF